MAADNHFAYHGYSAEKLAQLSAEFEAAKPFRHIAIDGFLLAPAHEVVSAFPAAEWPGWTVFEDHYQQGKRYCGDIERMPPLFQSMIQELAAPSFLAFLETITGIKGLIPDPHLAGGGLHSSGKGGILAPHADFHHYHRLELFRRINVLIYLNPGWGEADGGLLELFDSDNRSAPAKSIVPTYGRMVMFLTDINSIHGFSQPVSHDAQSRNSIATYYYTSEETRSYSGDGTTFWQAHGAQDVPNLMRLLAYKVLLRASAFFSRLAHAANPNLRRKPRG